MIDNSILFSNMSKANYEKFIGKHIRITSNCEMFPGFKVTGKLLSVSKTSYGESMLKVKTDEGRILSIGSSMRGFKVVES